MGGNLRLSLIGPTVIDSSPTMISKKVADTPSGSPLNCPKKFHYSISAFFLLVTNTSSSDFFISSLVSWAKIKMQIWNRPDVPEYSSNPRGAVSVNLIFSLTPLCLCYNRHPLGHRFLFSAVSRALLVDEGSIQWGQTENDGCHVYIQVD